MTTPSPQFVAGRPQRSAPIRGLAKAFGPLGKPLAGTRVFPLWGILRHRGRTSGTAYATTVVALRTPEGFIVPLPFGDATQWAKNLFAAGGGSIRSAGKEQRIIEPRVVELEAVAAELSSPIRFVARRLGLRHWVMVRRVSP